MNRIADFAIDKAMHLVARVLTGKRLRTVALGIDNLPAQGPALLVARHYHHLFDGLAFFAVVERRFHIVVALDWAKNWRTRFFMESLNHIARWPMVLREEALTIDTGAHHPVFKHTDIRRYQLSALRQSVELLADNRLVIIFPEGYPNIDPVYTPKSDLAQYLPFKPGFAAIAERAERNLRRPIPIIPVGISYDTGLTWVAQLRFGQPLYRRDFAARQNFVEFVEQEVQRLSEGKLARSQRSSGHVTQKDRNN